MSTLAERNEALAMDVLCSEDTLTVVLTDGRTVAAPIAWFPRLLDATQKQRAGWELIGGGIGIHWETIDEDISVASLLQPENFMRLPYKPSSPPAKKRRTKNPRKRRRA